MKIVELIPIRLADGAASVLTDGVLSAPHNALRVRVAATHVGYRNSNGFRYLDGEPTLDSLDSWTKPYPKPVIVHHEKERDPLGRVYRAERVDFVAPADTTDTTHDLPTGVVMLDMLITDPDGIRKVLTGEYLTVSVKSHSDAIQCSICEAHITPSKTCAHTRNEVYDDQTCSWDIGKRAYKEVSFVNEPADESDVHFAGVVSVDAETGDLPSFLSADELNEADDPGYIVLMDEHQSTATIDLVHTKDYEDDPADGETDPTEWTDDDMVLLEWLAAEVEKELGPSVDAKISEKSKKKMSKEGKGHFCGPMDPRKGRKSFPIPDCSHVTAGLRLLGRYTGPGSKAKIRACIERRGRALGCSSQTDDAEMVSLTEQLHATISERDALRAQLTPEALVQHEIVKTAMAAVTADLEAAKQTIATLQARTDTLEDQVKAVPDETSALRVLERENATLYALIHRLRAEQLADLEIRMGQQAPVVAATDPADARTQYVTQLMETHDSAALATAYRTLAKTTTFGMVMRPKTPTTTTVSPGLDRDPKSKTASPSVIVRSETGREKVGRLICKKPLTP